jgi:hypothetical protein
MTGQQTPTGSLAARIQARRATDDEQTDQILACIPADFGDRFEAGQGFPEVNLICRTAAQDAARTMTDRTGTPAGLKAIGGAFAELTTFAWRVITDKASEADQQDQTATNNRTKGPGR